MKPIREYNENIKFLTESAEQSGKKLYYIQGPFMEAESANRNGRRYPKETLMRETNRYIKEFVEKNRAFGELGHPDCYHSRTEIVTSRGIIPIKDVLENETVLTYNRNTNSIEWQQITEKIAHNHTGKMISFTGRNIDTLVTPGHRFLVEDRNGKIDFLTAQEIYDNQNTSKTKHTSIVKNINNAILPKDDDVFTLPGVKYNGHVTHRTQMEKYGQSVEIDKDVFCSFMGWWLSEGHISPVKNGVYITQNEGEKSDIIREILSKFPSDIKWKETIKNKKVLFWVSDLRLHSYLEPLGKHDSKYIPKEIKETSRKNLECLLDAFILGDGRGSRNKKYCKCDVFSTSKKLIEDLTEVSIKLGTSGRIFTQIAEKDYLFAGHIIKAKNKKPLHFSRIANSTRVWLDNRFITIKEVDYDDMVYCVRVPNETFYAFDDGKGFWSGNCPEVKLERVCHIIKELKFDGNNIIGKAKVITENPYGKILKNFIDEGATLGVSSRGLGSLVKKGELYEVQDDFYLAAVDVVADPSAKGAFVEGVLEHKEWIYESGVWKQICLEKLKKSSKTLSRKAFESKVLKEFQRVMGNINNQKI
jgi:hypothetical protein